MTPLTNPPFSYEKGSPPFHLRPWTQEELEQAKRMKEKAEALARAARPADPLQRVETL